MTAPYTAVDALRYLTQHTADVVDAVLSQLADNCGMHIEDHPELVILQRLVSDTYAVSGPLNEPQNTYSDGRAVSSPIEIVDGIVTRRHLWHPDPARNTPVEVESRG
ncbi:hypothetical protein ACFPPE_07470 [Agromyces tardus]|uniref:hypothetical protein n=1 Tax=Agromyces tardus TaxID=2583849 RepID=UPI00360624F5